MPRPVVFVVWNELAARRALVRNAAAGRASEQQQLMQALDADLLLDFLLFG
jgi:hypothetical protein